MHMYIGYDVLQTEKFVNKGKMYQSIDGLDSGKQLNWFTVLLEFLNFFFTNPNGAFHILENTESRVDTFDFLCLFIHNTYIGSVDSWNKILGYFWKLRRLLWMK